MKKYFTAPYFLLTTTLLYFILYTFGHFVIAAVISFLKDSITHTNANLTSLSETIIDILLFSTIIFTGILCVLTIFLFFRHKWAYISMCISLIVILSLNIFTAIMAPDSLRIIRDGKMGVSMILSIIGLVLLFFSRKYFFNDNWKQEKIANIVPPSPYLFINILYHLRWGITIIAVIIGFFNIWNFMPQNIPAETQGALFGAASVFGIAMIISLRIFFTLSSRLRSIFIHAFFIIIFFTGIIWNGGIIKNYIETNEKDDIYFEEFKKTITTSIQEIETQYPKDLISIGFKEILLPSRIEKDSDFSESYEILKNANTVYNKFKTNRLAEFDGRIDRMKKIPLTEKWTKRSSQDV